MTEKVFVYGTLKRGGRLSRYMYRTNFICEDILEDFDMYTNGYFPMIVEGSGVVYGEVYEIDKAEIPRLDRVESEGLIYRRTTVITKAGHEVYAYVWLGEVGEGLSKICNGNFDVGESIKW